MKIAIVGAPSTFKTSTAEILSTLLKPQGVEARVCVEYARKYILEHTDGTIREPWQNLQILRGQIQKEALYSKLPGVTICDSASMVAYVYAKAMLRDQRPLQPHYLKMLKDMHEDILQHVGTYDEILVFTNQGTRLVQDGIRTQSDDSEREGIFRGIVGFLDAEAIPYSVIVGDGPEQKAKRILGMLAGRLGIKGATQEATPATA